MIGLHECNVRPLTKKIPLPAVAPLHRGSRAAPVAALPEVSVRPLERSQRIPIAMPCENDRASPAPRSSWHPHDTNAPKLSKSSALKNPATNHGRSVGAGMPTTFACPAKTFSLP